jgi:hypothetical protein
MMYLFCLLWIPLFYLFRRSVTGRGAGLWALVLGTITAFFHFFAGNLVEPGGFEFSRWLSGFVDIVGLPVLVPIITCSLLMAFRLLSGDTDLTGFTLLALVPATILRTLSRDSPSPMTLALIPLLYTAQAVGISFFITCIIRILRWYVIIPLGLCILALPVLAASSYWAFFTHDTLLGFLLFFLTMIPMIISVALDYARAG